MKRFLWILAQASIVVTGLASAALVRAADAGTRPETTELTDIAVHFKVKVLGMARITGRFDRLRGELLPAAEGEDPAVRMRIDVESVSTDDAWRDAYLRGPTFFKAERYPHITFSGSCLLRRENTSARIVGELNLHGTTKRVVFDLRAQGAHRSGQAQGYRATATIRRSEFGLDALKHIVADEVEITVAMQAGPSACGAERAKV